MKSGSEMSTCSRGCGLPYGGPYEALAEYLRTKKATSVETLWLLLQWVCCCLQRLFDVHAMDWLIVSVVLLEGLPRFFFTGTPDEGPGTDPLD